LDLDSEVVTVESEIEIDYFDFDYFDSVLVEYRLALKKDHLEIILELICLALRIVSCFTFSNIVVALLVLRVQMRIVVRASSLGTTASYTAAAADAVVVNDSTTSAKTSSDFLVASSFHISFKRRSESDAS